MARFDDARRRAAAVVAGAPTPAQPTGIFEPTADAPFARLCIALGLSCLDLEAILLAIATHLDPALRALVGDRPVTTGLALRVLLPSVDQQVAALAEGFPRRLIACGLLQRPRRVALDAELVPTRRAIAAALGCDPFEDAPRFARMWRADGVVRSFDHSPELAAAVLRRRRADASALVIVSGETGAGKTTFARAVANLVASQALEIDLALLRAQSPATEVATLLGELVTDAALFRLPVILDGVDTALAASDPVAVELAARLDDVGASVVLVTGDATALHPRLAARAALRVELGRPSAELRSMLWRQTLAGRVSEDALTEVGESFPLTPRQIHHAATLVVRTGAVPRAAALAQLDSAGALLEPTLARRGLGHLVFSPETRAQLDEIVAALHARQTLMQEWGMRRALSRGRGLSALFDGEPGTGKTAACEAIAVEVALRLLRVNVATLVDKYIGETEKNLVRVFDRARAGGAILLFDEADSLFGTRTAINGANDRYANLEVNVLLQLMEEHTGVVFLTTNLKGNLDPAFLRRITYKVEFPLPDVGLRERMWEVSLPSERVDLGRGDYAALARAFPLSGGSIQAAAVRGAYRAAGAQRKVTMDDLVDCAGLECQTLGKVVELPRRVKEVV